MKWLKIVLLLLVFGLVFAVVSAGAGWWLSRGTPDWYRSRRASATELSAAAGRAERQMQRTLSWAQDQQAYNASSQVSTPSTHPARSQEISLSEDELNGFFQKWDSTFGWSKKLGKYLSGPQLALRDGHLILAAVMKDSGMVLSIEFAPRLQDGALRVPVARVLAGRLPLPHALWARYQQKLETAVGAHLPAWQQGARISADGAANGDAVAAAMSELLQDMLADRAAPPVVFLPYAVHGSPRSLPVKITHLEIANQTLTLDLEPMSRPQRQTLLETIRTGDTPQADAVEADAAATQ